MFRILTCITVEHDLRLVLLAALICFLACFVAISLIQRAKAASGRARMLWLGAAGASSGFGIWATHFIAMLAYDPGVVMGFGTHLTLLSLAVAIVVTTIGASVATYFSNVTASVAGGLIVGAGVSTMHYLGMAALELPGDIAWDGALVAFAITSGALFSSLAMVQCFRQEGHSAFGRVSATVLMALGVVCLHFVSMAAVTVVPGPIEVNDNSILSPALMAPLIAVVAFSLLFAGLTAAIFARQAENAVNESTRQFAMLVQGVSDYAMYMLDPNGLVENWNAGAERNKGYLADEIIGQHFSRFYCEEDRKAGLPDEALWTARKEGKYEDEGWRHRKDGTRFWAQVTIDPIYDGAGKLVGYAKITKDATKEKTDADRIQDVSRNLDLALENMSQGLCLFDNEERLVLSNARFAEIIGFPGERIRAGVTFRGLIDRALSESYGAPEIWLPKASELYGRHRAVIHSGGGTVVEKRLNGNSVQIVYRALPDGGWVATYEDISERIRNEEQIAFMARHDGLTGLPNRANFNDSLADAIEHAKRSSGKVAAIGIDLDRFKEINDTRGHAVGDQVLVTLAKRMQECLGSDETVARFGGDEFAAFKRFDDIADLNEFMQRLEKCLQEDFEIDGYEIRPGASLGVSIYPQDADNLETLLNNADLAMYRAKDALTQSVCFYEVSMDEAARNRRHIAKDLWLAVERNELQLHYQVQKAVDTGSTTGYEVLLRWQHETNGMVPPSEFIPIAEECGAILPIGEWVLREACREAASWVEQHKIAVNLSPVQLANADVADLVHRVLLETGLAPNRLELEITETTIIGDKERALHTLRQIKALGVTIAIDDFGTGYSSLETLRSFPFDKIKLDRSFMNEVEESPQAKAILRAIVALGQTLQVPVLAEGVETKDQLEVLLAEGCNEAQGYFLGRPAPMASQLPPKAA